MVTHKPYSHDFKLEAVKLVTERGMTRAQVARDLGITTHALRAWLRALAPEARLATMNSTEAEQLASKPSAC